MDASEIDRYIDSYKYLLGKIGRYKKNNQYIYLRSFYSWVDDYNQVADRLNTDKVISVSAFKLRPTDHSSTGKSIKNECVERLIKAINHQIGRLERKTIELKAQTDQQQACRAPQLEQFFARDHTGATIKPTMAKDRVLVAIPANLDSGKIYRQAIQPVLEAQGLSGFLVDQPKLDNNDLFQICQEIYACRTVIVDLTGQAANTMLILGLAYGIGKPLVILQPQAETEIGKTTDARQLRYSDATDIKAELGTLLSQLRQC